MKRLPLKTRVSVSGRRKQAPFEDVIQAGTVVGHLPGSGYLVFLDHAREADRFLRRELATDGVPPLPAGLEGYISGVAA